MTRYDFAPLERQVMLLLEPEIVNHQLVGATARRVGERLGVSGRSVQRYRVSGLSEAQADRLAVAAGLHPSLVWPDYLKDALMSDRAKNAARMRRYRASPRGAAAERRAKRRHYAANHPYYKAQAARWREENKERVLLYNRLYNAARDPEKRRQQAREATRRYRERLRSVAPLRDDQDQEVA